MPLDQIGEEKEMSFLDHLEELRWHIVRALVAIVGFTVLAFIFKDLVVNTIILGPSQSDFWTYRKLCELAALLNSPSLCIDTLPFELISRKLGGQFMAHVTVSFATGLVLGFPYAFWEIWRFIRPGLHPRERSASRGATISVSTLFMLGIAFGYFVIAPVSIRFFATYELSSALENRFDLNSYINSVTMITFGSGLLFQLPVVVYFLTKAGIVSAALLRKYRKHAIVVILVLGAMITPPDPFSQVLVALPLMLLYQMSIFIARRIEKRERQTEKNS